MEKRAEGFWWVRHVEGAWQVAEIVHYAHPEGEAFEILLPGCKGLLVDEEKASRIVEWGPYLGKDPGRAVAREAHDGVEVSMDGGATWPIWVPGWQVDRDVAMEAKRAAAYEPSTDYEGEDTRALDGAGAPPVITMAGQDDLAFRSLLRAPFVGTRSIITPSQELLDALDGGPEDVMMPSDDEETAP